MIGQVQSLLHDSGDTEHVRIDNAANSFCNGVGQAGNILAENFFQSSEYPLC